MYTFEYHGGIAHDGSKAGKFLLFLIIGDKEVPFFQATKTGLVRPASIAPDASPMSVRNQCTYECESPIVKLFMKEDRKKCILIHVHIFLYAWIWGCNEYIHFASS